MKDKLPGIFYLSFSNGIEVIESQDISFIFEITTLNNQIFSATYEIKETKLSSQEYKFEFIMN